MALNPKVLNRRGAIALAGALGTAVLTVRTGGFVAPATAAGKDEAKAGEDVSATEDLMREHGVIRRILHVYSELAARLQPDTGKFDPAALADAAKLFREFGEDSHERMLEEAYIFPEVRKAGGPNEKLAEVLVAQHDRGRQITDYIQRVGSGGKIDGNAKPLSDALVSTVRMYSAHAAWEDTIIFPSWKAMQPKAKLEELADKFEDIEHEQFGKDGFEDAVAHIARIEQTLGLGDLAAFTAAPPPV